MPDHDISFGYQPGQEIDYVQITSPVNVGTGATTIITSNSVLYDGTSVICEFFAPAILVDTQAAGDDLFINLLESGTQIGVLGIIQLAQTAFAAAVPVICRYRFTPSSGLHTYVISCKASSTTGTPQVKAGSGGTGLTSYLPAFVRFTKV